MASLSLCEDPDLGRYFVAAQDLPENTVLLVDDPFVAVVCDSWLEETCSYCFAYKRPRQPVHCANCSLVRYCSNACQALDTLHTISCSSHQKLRQWILSASDERIHTQLDRARFILGVFYAKQNNEIAWNAFLELQSCESWMRCVLKECWPNGAILPRREFGAPEDATWILSDDELDYSIPENNHSRQTFCDTQTIRTSSVEDQVAWRAEARIVARLIDYLTPFLSELFTLESEQIKRHCLDICYRERGNAFGYWSDDDLLGYAIVIQPSYFNHSCQPNVRKRRVHQNDRNVVEKGRTWVFETNRNVRKGEMLCIAYAGEAQRESVEERHARLYQDFFFHCNCQEENQIN